MKFYTIDPTICSILLDFMLGEDFEKVELNEPKRHNLEVQKSWL